MKIRIKVNAQHSLEAEHPSTLILVQDDWNDWWEFKNQYFAVYTSQIGARIPLGRVKLEDPRKPPSTNPEHPLTVGYTATEVTDTLISLGQSDDYYEALSKLPEEEREAFCIRFHDAVWNPRPLQENKDQPAVRKSLLREIPLSTVVGEFHRVLRHEGQENYYHLKYTHNSLDASFVVDPRDRPHTNLHVLIGRNGVGKTTLLRKIARIVATGFLDYSENFEVFDEDGEANDVDVFAGVQYVSWGPFDKFSEPQTWQLRSGVGYAQISLDGIHQLKPDGGFELPAVNGFKLNGRSSRVSQNYPDIGKPADIREDPPESFARACGLVIQRGRQDLWLDAVDSLESDPQFKQLPILSHLRSTLNSHRPQEHEEEVDYDTIVGKFKDLSEGHQAVLLTITYLAATLSEQTLVVLDEPEAHLHPPLLSSLVRCLTELLARKNAMGIVATHSPVVLQEVPRNCALKISVTAGERLASRPRIETFGEDISELTYEVFELEVEDSGFYRLLKEIAAKHDDYDSALNSINRKLGMTGRSVLRTLIAIEHPPH